MTKKRKQPPMKWWELLLVIVALAAMLFLTGCTTPRTMLKNPKTGETAACGGNLSSSLQGGAIGYHIQRQRDKECVADLEARGYKVEEVK